MAAKRVMVIMALLVWPAVATGQPPNEEEKNAPAPPGPPSCIIVITPEHPNANENVVFAANAEVPSGWPPVVTWDFGDGHLGKAINTFHRYTASGTYQIVCTVVAGGETATCRSEITIGAPAATPANAARSVVPIGGGWHLLYPPENGDHLLNNLRVKRADTGEELAFCDAWSAGWVLADLYWYDRDDQGYKITSCDIASDDDTLRQGRVYFVCSNIGEIQLIFP